MLKEVDIKENDMIDFDEFLRLMNVEEEVDLFREQSMHNLKLNSTWNLSGRSITNEKSVE
jgi:Ca2+-binding EF-hand superfamily protein